MRISFLIAQLIRRVLQPDLRMEATGHVDPSIAVNTAQGGMTMQQLSQILRLAYHATQFGDPHLPPFNYTGPTSAFAEVVGVLADSYIFFSNGESISVVPSCSISWLSKGQKISHESRDEELCQREPGSRWPNTGSRKTRTTSFRERFVGKVGHRLQLQTTCA